MPLMHSKTPKAFKKNIEIEMEHGKPQKQAVAIAYSEKRAAEHKASGGCIGPSCTGCDAAGCYAGGGKVGGGWDKYRAPDEETPHPDWADPEEEEEGEEKPAKERMKHPLEHMPKPKKMAEGGSVSSATKREDNEKGVHQALWSHEPGVSAMGKHVRAAAGTSDEFDKADSYGAAKKSLNRTHAEARSMPKPHGHFAIGGEVEDSPEHPDAHEDKELMDSEMHDMLGDELMAAFDAKDKKRIVESLEALVLSCMDKE